jgi:hypothetical protein
MASRGIKIILVAGFVAAVALVSPGSGLAAVGCASAAPAGAVQPMANKAHVNSNIDYTWLYDSPYGDAHSIALGPCVGFYYDRIVNGRYHAYGTGFEGWVSTARAGSGWCFD